jgi:hypothetical protein
VLDRKKRGLSLPGKPVLEPAPVPPPVKIAISFEAFAKFIDELRVVAVPDPFGSIRVESETVESVLAFLLNAHC